MSAIPADLNKIMISETGDAQVIVLRERGGSRVLPIWIGMPEALAIQRKIQGEDPPRPMTHDLLCDAVAKLGGTLASVLIDRFVSTPTGGTFHAKLVLQRGQEALTVDARPSDAIALAVRMGSPIFIDEQILNEEGHDVSTLAKPGETPDDEIEEEESSEDDDSGESGEGKGKGVS